MHQKARARFNQKVAAQIAGLALAAAFLVTAAGADELLGPASVRDPDTGFTIRALFVSDPDWREKWATPSSERPVFNAAHSLLEGDEGYLLIFFGHPVLQDGRARLQCDLTIRDSSQNTARSSVVCFDEVLKSPPHYVFLTPLVVTYRHEASDQAGTVEIDVAVTDLNSGARLGQSNSFQLIKRDVE